MQRVFGWARRLGGGSCDGPRTGSGEHQADGGDQEQDLEARIVRALGPFEAYLVALQRIFIWERPTVSVAALVLVNTLFFYWAIASCMRKIVITCVSAFSLYFYYLWVTKIWPEIRVAPQEPEDDEEWTPVHPSVLSVPEIGRYLHRFWCKSVEFYYWLKRLKEEQPAWFGFVLTAIFVAAAVISSYVSPVMLIYSCVMALMVVPGLVFQVAALPKVQEVLEWKRNLFLWSHLFNSTEGEEQQGEDNGGKVAVKKEDGDELSEYLPEASKENMELLEKAVQMGMDEEEENEEAEESPKDTPEEAKRVVEFLEGLEESSGPVTLTPQIEAMPSHEETTDDLEDLSLLPISPPQPQPSEETQPVKPTKDDAGIQFVSTHFGDLEDSSSDEDSAFARGLSFGHGVEEAKKSTTVPMTATTAAASLASHLPHQVAVLGAAMGQLVWKMESERKAAEEEEEFEFISKEDLA